MRPSLTRRRASPDVSRVSTIFRRLASKLMLVSVCDTPNTSHSLAVLMALSSTDSTAYTPPTRQFRMRMCGLPLLTGKGD